MHLQTVVFGDVAEPRKISCGDRVASGGEIGFLFIDPPAVERRRVAADLHCFGRADRLCRELGDGGDDTERPVARIDQCLHRYRLVLHAQLGETGIQRARGGP